MKTRQNKKNQIENEGARSTSTLKVFGKNSVLEALEQGLGISKIWLLSSAAKDDKATNILQAAKSKRIPVNRVDRQDLERIAAGESKKSLSIIAELAAIQFEDESFLEQAGLSKILIPVNIEDPHNLGAIMRSCKAFGVDALVLANRKTTSITSTVVNSSAGAALSLATIRVNNIVSVIEKLKKLGFWIYGTDVSAEAQDYNQIKFDKKSVLVLGNEGKGLSDNVKKHCDFLINIPMEFESVNVSVANGILLAKLYQDQKELTDG